MSNNQKIEHLKHRIEDIEDRLAATRPLSPSPLAALHRPIDIEITHTSNAFDGNTLILRETKEVVEHGNTVSGKPLKGHLEAQDHHFAPEYMYELASQSTPSGARTIREPHTLVMKRSGPDTAGIYSLATSYLSGSETAVPHPHQTPELMRDFWTRTGAIGAYPRQRFTRRLSADADPPVCRRQWTHGKASHVPRPCKGRLLSGRRSPGGPICLSGPASNSLEPGRHRAVPCADARASSRHNEGLCGSIGETLENEKVLSEMAGGADHEESASYAAFLARQREIDI